MRYASTAKVVSLTRSSCPPLCAIGPLRGLPPLDKFVRDFTARIHQPPYQDWDTLVNLGAAEALTKTLDVIAERGSGVLVDEWAYNHSLEQIRSLGLQTVSVPSDTGGLDPVYLDNILRSWDEGKRGFKRPRVLLTVRSGLFCARETEHPRGDEW